MRVCSFEGCSRSLEARGYCFSHWKQLKEGKPLTRLLSDTSFSERFWSRVDIRSDSECWEWTRGRKSGGYGAFSNPEGKAVSAHRFAFQDTFGYTPRVVDHICRNRLCVNPSHLQDTDMQGNAENTGLRSDNTSGFKGVSFHKSSGKWMAYGSYRGKIHYLGLHKTAQDAAVASREFRLSHHTNNVEDRK